MSEKVQKYNVIPKRSLKMESLLVKVLNNRMNIPNLNSHSSKI